MGSRTFARVCDGPPLPATARHQPDPDDCMEPPAPTAVWSSQPNVATVSAHTRTHEVVVVVVVVAPTPPYACGLFG